MSRGKDYSPRLRWEQTANPFDFAQDGAVRILRPLSLLNSVAGTKFTKLVHLIDVSRTLIPGLQYEELQIHRGLLGT